MLVEPWGSGLPSINSPNDYSGIDKLVRTLQNFNWPQKGQVRKAVVFLDSGVDEFKSDLAWWGTEISWILWYNNFELVGTVKSAS